ncbi:MAG: hypothetical protein QOI06_3191 [Nocardioidaceae bacterium]|jgi:uncharacterized repeat protein (TIGR03847 family)|nr:hypothetical protein [Nocardioidaceae bacterium]
MPTVVHSFEEPERFVAGTVGPPGQRTFFLQARDGGRITSVALEKQQVALLAERLDLLLDEALRRLGGDPRIPAIAPPGLADKGPLEQPIDEEFRVGTITLSWEEESGYAVIELFSVTEDNVVAQELEDEAGSVAEDGDEQEVGDDLGADGVEEAFVVDEDDEEQEQLVVLEVEVEASEVLVVRLAPAYARAFVRRAQTVVSAGRPACQFCGGPIDPEGHLCPRANGFKRSTV